MARRDPDRDRAIQCGLPFQTALNGTYKFPKVRPGDYRLRAQISFTRLWDMPVTVGEKTVLDLNQDNAVAAKDVFFKRKP